MKNFGTVERDKLNADGTLRNKYDLPEVKPNDGYLRMAAAFLVGNALLVAKNVFFTDKAGADDDSQKKTTASLIEEVGQAGEAARFRIVDGRHLVDNQKGDNDDFKPEAEEKSAGLTGGGTSSSNLAQADESNVVEFPSLRKVGNISGGPQAVIVEDQDGFKISVPPSPTIPDLTGGAPGTDAPGSDMPETDGNAGSDGDSDEDKQNPRPMVNRLPVVASMPIALGDLYINQSIAIAMTDLLHGAYDPDGDAIFVRNLEVSSGDLTYNAGYGWDFVPTSLHESTVTFSFEVSDDIGGTPHSAELNILGLAGDDIFGSDDGEVIWGTPGMDRIEAGDGNDVIHAGADDDVVYAGGGDDIVYAGAGNDVVYAGDGDDVVYAGAGDDLVFGEDGNDTIYGEEGDDALSGGLGDDVIHGDEGNDTIVGDEGNDELSGGDGNDFLGGGAGDDVGYGGTGNDVIEAGDGDDTVYAGEGDDIVLSGAGDDFVFGEDGSDTLSGDAGDDVISGGAGGDEIDGGSGDDVLLGDAGDDQVVGDSGDDILIGDVGDDDLSGGADNDLLIGGAGDDDISGDDGDDIILASTDDGSDTIDGGAGIDTYDASQTTDGVTIDLNAGEAVDSFGNIDVLSNVENATGGSGNDTLIANAEVNVMSGGAGQDVFVFLEGNSRGSGGHMRDRIEDFEVGDRLDFTSFDCNSEEDGLQRLQLNFLDAEYDGIGQAWVRYEGEDGEDVLTLLQFRVEDIDYEDGVYDFELEIVGRHELNDSNVMF